MPMGFSFQPGADVSMAGGQGQGGRSVPAPTSAVKVLSFRMPKHAPQGAIAPSALLNASGAGGVQSGGLSPQLLQMLLSAFSAPQGQQGGPFGGGPAQLSPSSSPSFGPPRVTPGDTGSPIKYDGPEPQGPIAPPTDFFDRTQGQLGGGLGQPSGPFGGPSPQATGLDMPSDYQSYGMLPDYFR
jgi:hypothetical protein